MNTLVKSIKNVIVYLASLVAGDDLRASYHPLRILLIAAGITLLAVSVISIVMDNR